MALVNGKHSIGVKEFTLPAISVEVATLDRSNANGAAVDVTVADGAGEQGEEDEDGEVVVGSNCNGSVNREEEPEEFVSAAV